jgi:hypothetical protein
MGVCLAKSTERAQHHHSTRCPPNGSRTKLLSTSRRQHAKAVKQLHKFIEEIYCEGKLNQIESQMTYGLFLGILDRYEFSMDPIFAAQMRALEIALEKTIEQRTDPGYLPAPDESRIKAFDDYFMTTFVNDY